jgi:membrane protein
MKQPIIQRFPLPNGGVIISLRRSTAQAGLHAANRALRSERAQQRKEENRGGRTMLKRAYNILWETISEYIADEALTRGAAISFYTVTSMAPVLVIIIALAGLALGEDAAQGAIVEQLGGLIGVQSASLLQSAIRNASNIKTGTLATLISVGTLLITASGVFVELQNTLNVIWKVEVRGDPVTRLVRARAASLGLVAAMAFVLIVSLIISALLNALGDLINAYVPNGSAILSVLNFLLSFALLAALFGAIYKVLPEKQLEWRHVIIGGITTALLFDIGKFFIGLYIGSTAIASSYGAGGAILVILLWIYYSSQIFLLGAEFTKVYTRHIHGYVPDTLEAALAREEKKEVR